MKFWVYIYAAETKTKKPPSELKEDAQEVEEDIEKDRAVPKPESKPENPEMEQKSVEVERESSLNVFSYDQLKSKSDDPAAGIDFKRREVSDAGLTLDKLLRSVITLYFFLDGSGILVR